MAIERETPVEPGSRFMMCTVQKDVSGKIKGYSEPKLRDIQSHWKEASLESFSSLLLYGL